MQYAVPQFTDVEDKLIGPLTLKQFLVVLGFGAILFFFWSILGIGILFYMIAIPLAGVAAYVTLKKFNGRPFFVYFLPLISFMLSPKVMVFKREGGTVHFTSKEAAKEKTVQPTAADFEPADSRLRKLSYLLDQDLKKEKAVLEEEVFKAPPKVAAPPAPKDAPKSGPAKFAAGLPKQFNMTPAAKTAPGKRLEMAAPPAPAVTESGPMQVQTQKIAPQTPVTKQFNPDDILRG